MYVHSQNDIPLGQTFHIDAIFRLKVVDAATMQPYDPYWQWHHWHYGSAWPQWGYGYSHREYRPSPCEGPSMVTKLSVPEPAEMPKPKKKPSSSSESASSKEKGDRSGSETSPAAKADDGKPDSPDFSPPPSPAASKAVSRAPSREKKPAQKVDKKGKKDKKEKSEKSDKKHKENKERKSKHDDKPGTSRSSKGKEQPRTPEQKPKSPQEEDENLDAKWVQCPTCWRWVHKRGFHQHYKTNLTCIAYQKKTNAEKPVLENLKQAFKCPICPKWFDADEDLQRHLSSKHPVKKEMVDRDHGDQRSRSPSQVGSLGPSASMVSAGHRRNEDDRRSQISLRERPPSGSGGSIYPTQGASSSSRGQGSELADLFQATANLLRKGSAN